MPAPTVTERRVIAAAELRFEEDGDGKQPRVGGYAAVFNSPSLDLGGGLVRFREQIAPGAFADALSTSDVPLLIEHRDLALADTKTKTLRLSEDKRGLKFDADLDPDDPDVRRIIPKLRRGTLRSMSFGFLVAEDGAKWERRDGGIFRTVTKVKELVDVSLVTQPAYPDTSVALRSLEAWQQGIDQAGALTAGLGVDIAERVARLRMLDGA